MNLIETFQGFVAQVPELVQPLIVALAGAIPFIEGEGAVSIGIIGGIHPVVAAIAAIIGNFLCVAVLVIASSGARTAIVNRSRSRRPPRSTQGVSSAASDVYKRQNRSCGCALLVHAVGERSVSLRRWLVKAAGGIRSANADMSSVKTGEKPVRRKRKVFYATFIGVE